MLMASQSWQAEKGGKEPLTKTTAQKTKEREDRGHSGKRKGEFFFQDPRCPGINDACASCSQLESKKGPRVSTLSSFHCYPPLDF